MPALIKPRQILSSSRLAASMVVLSSALLMAACHKPVEKTEDIRPVRVIQVAPQGVAQSTEFSGDVRSRTESKLGFRVGGKVLSRKVDVGNLVKRGQVLMTLDAGDLQLAQSQARAALVAAESNRDLAKAERSRFQDLLNNKFVSQAVFDAKDTAYKAAQASAEQAQAAFKLQGNQAGYTQLVADVDGVVASVEADVGQVVAPGVPVVLLAKSGDKEVQFGIPEDRVELMRALPEVQVRLWSNPRQLIKGKLREISPQADPVTRTYAARVTLVNAPQDVKLGQTAYVSYQLNSPQALIRVPLTAMYQEKSLTSVWVVDGGVVKLVPVVVAGVSGNDVLIAQGLQTGQKVVTAGVHVLKPGQKVKILDPEPIAVEAPGQAMPLPGAAASAPAATQAASVSTSAAVQPAAASASAVVSASAASAPAASAGAAK